MRSSCRASESTVRYQQAATRTSPTCTMRRTPTFGAASCRMRDSSRRCTLHAGMMIAPRRTW